MLLIKLWCTLVRTKESESLETEQHTLFSEHPPSYPPLETCSSRIEKSHNFDEWIYLGIYEVKERIIVVRTVREIFRCFLDKSDFE